MKPVVDCPALAIFPSFLKPARADDVFEQLLIDQPWPANHYEVFGRRFNLPRLQTWHADEGVVYSYSNNLLQNRPWSPLLLAIRKSVEQATGYHFNAVLVNYYRDGSDYVGWHSDDEVELGGEPLIASLSLGAARRFAYRRKHVQAEGSSEKLNPGSLLVMRPEFQSGWEHSVPPDPGEPGGRINLTFRYVYPPQ